MHVRAANRTRGSTTELGACFCCASHQWSHSSGFARCSHQRTRGLGKGGGGGGGGSEDARATGYSTKSVACNGATSSSGTMVVGAGVSGPAEVAIRIVISDASLIDW